jgi:hypothetical protein
MSGFQWAMQHVPPSPAAISIELEPLIHHSQIGASHYKGQSILVEDRFIAHTPRAF